MLMQTSLLQIQLKENEVAKEPEADDCSQASLSVEVPANEVEKQAIDIPDCQVILHSLSLHLMCHPHSRVCRKCVSLRTQWLA